MYLQQAWLTIHTIITIAPHNKLLFLNKLLYTVAT